MYEIGYLPVYMREGDKQNFVIKRNFNLPNANFRLFKEGSKLDVANEFSSGKVKNTRGTTVTPLVYPPKGLYIMVICSGDENVYGQPLIVKSRNDP